MKNPAAFVVLQDVFLKCTVEQTSLLMLDVINVVFKYVITNDKQMCHTSFLMTTCSSGVLNP